MWQKEKKKYSSVSTNGHQKVEDWRGRRWRSPATAFWFSEALCSSRSFAAANHPSWADGAASFCFTGENKRHQTTEVPFLLLANFLYLELTVSVLDSILLKSCFSVLLPTSAGAVSTIPGKSAVWMLWLWKAWRRVSSTRTTSQWNTSGPATPPWVARGRGSALVWSAQQKRVSNYNITIL